MLTAPRFRPYRPLLTCTLAAAAIASSAASAREWPVPIDIAATALPDALAELARETGISIGTPGSLPRIIVRPVRGSMPVGRALERMLAGSGYRARQVGGTAWRIERVPAPAAATPPPARPRPVARPLSPAGPGEEIIVTATKERAALPSVPGAVAVAVPARFPEPAATSGTAALASRIEGFASTGEGAGRNRIFVRGVADSPFAGSTQSTVALLLGDARLTWSAPDPDIRLVDVAQVELLKGPQGSLYGSGALGGIYRIVPHRADPAHTFASGEVAGTVTGSGDAGGSASAVANVAILPGVAALRVVAYDERIPGWIDTGSRGDSNRQTAGGWRANLAADIGPWKVDASALGQAIDSADTNYTYARGARSRPAQIAEPHDNDLIHGALRVERTGSVNWLASSGITRQTIDDRYDATVGAAGLGVADPRALDSERLYTVWDSELRAHGTAGGLRWLGGLSYLEAAQRDARWLTAIGGAETRLDTFHRRSSEAAVFGQVTVPLSARFDVAAGGRLFRGTLDDLRSRGAKKQQRIETRWGLTPSLRLAWRPRPGRLLYADYDTAVREGGARLDAGGNAVPIDGDELHTVSAGWRETAGPLRIDLGLYHSRWSSVQSDMLGPGGLIEPANVGQGSISGAELAVDATLARGLALSAGAMIQSALLDATDAIRFGEDRRLPVAPSSTARIGLAYGFVVGAWDVSTELRGRYVGRGRLSFDPALDRPIGDYVDTSFSVGARRGAWAFGVTAQNLLDARGDVFAYGNPLRLFAQPQHVSQTPRTVTISLRWQPGR